MCNGKLLGGNKYAVWCAMIVLCESRQMLLGQYLHVQFKNICLKLYSGGQFLRNLSDSASMITRHDSQN